MEQLPSELYYKLGEYLVAPDLINLHQVNTEISTYRLVRFQLPQILFDKIGFQNLREVTEFGKNLQNIPNLFPDIIQEVSDIVMGSQSNYKSIKYANKMRRVIRNNGWISLKLERAQHRSFWGDIINNYRIITSTECHEVFRIPKFTYRLVRLHCPTALALIY